MDSDSKTTKRSADDSAVKLEVTTEAIAGTLPVLHSQDRGDMLQDRAATKNRHQGFGCRRRLRLLFRWAERWCRFRLLRLLWWHCLPRRPQAAIQFRSWVPATRTSMPILPCNDAPTYSMTGNRFQRQNCT